jgi:hypothetical protein
MPQAPPREDPVSPESELVRTAADAVRLTEELIRAEFALAKAEFRHDLKRMAAGVGALAGTFALVQAALIVWAGAIVLWVGARGSIAALVGVGLAVLAGLSGYLGVILVSRRYLARTHERLQTDVRSIKESELRRADRARELLADDVRQLARTASAVTRERARTVRHTGMVLLAAAALTVVAAGTVTWLRRRQWRQSTPQRKAPPPLWFEVARTMLINASGPIAAHVTRRWLLGPPNPHEPRPGA